MKTMKKAMKATKAMKTAMKTEKKKKLTRGQTITMRNLAWEAEEADRRQRLLAAPMTCIMCDDPIPGHELNDSLRQWSPGIAAAVCYSCERGTASEGEP